MKRFFCIICSLIIALTAAGCDERGNTGKESVTPQRVIYDHVIFVGIDGMGSFSAFTDTPELDKIFLYGATTLTAQAVQLTKSAQNWSSMIFGVDASVHGRTNSNLETEIWPEDSIYPSVFKRILDVEPYSKLGMFVNWTPIYSGIVENSVKQKITSQTGGNDSTITQHVINEITERKPKFLFVQLDEVDAAGHNAGFGTPAHLAAITQADERVGLIYNAVTDVGIADKTLFIVGTDHGGTGVYHGDYYTDSEKDLFFGVAGPGVKYGNISVISVCDISSLILYALGLPVPEYNKLGYLSQVPQGIFEYDADIPQYRQ